MPDNIQTIGWYVFRTCAKYRSIVVSDGVKKICPSAFYNCKNLEQVTIPSSVTMIDKSSFVDCPNLSIHAPAGSYAEQYAKENNIPFVAE